MLISFEQTFRSIDVSGPERLMCRDAHYSCHDISSAGPARNFHVPHRNRFRPRNFLLSHSLLRLITLFFFLEPTLIPLGTLVSIACFLISHVSKLGLVAILYSSTTDFHR